jgi:hypothetical protein
MAKKSFGSIMELMEYFREAGRRGGKKAAEGMSSAARKERAKKAAAARWTKKAPGGRTANRRSGKG